MTRWTPRTLGIGAAAGACVIDLLHKFWMLQIFDIQSRQPVHVAPFLDLVLVWNRGISYSLLTFDSKWGRFLLLGFILAASIFIIYLMWTAANRWLGLGFGLIAGGALGNLIDRLINGAVADIFYFFLETERWGRLSWYVFNLADVAIVAGVALLLYEAFFVEKVKDQHE